MEKKSTLVTCSMIAGALLSVSVVKANTNSLLNYNGLGTAGEVRNRDRCGFQREGILLPACFVAVDGICLWRHKLFRCRGQRQRCDQREGDGNEIHEAAFVADG